jgi:hypothetical protein
MVIALGVLLMRAPPPMPWAKDMVDVEVADDRADLPRIYVPLTDTLTIALSHGGPRMEAELALAVRGSTDDLLSLNSMVQARIAPIEAGVVRAAQELVAKSADSLTLHAELPVRLRETINREIGTDEWPDPVEEVLITALAVR